MQTQRIVLVSFIGIGTRDKTTETYSRTTYDFGTGTEVVSSVFFDALLSSGKYSFAGCILIGTRTSSWATLLDRDFTGEGKFISLYEQLEDSREQAGGISDDLLGKLEEALQEIWCLPITCHANDADINEKNAYEILAGYCTLLAGERTDRIVVDITHGFRSMPVLLMGALHLRQALVASKADIEVVYGELRRSGPSPVRYLDAVWKSMDLAQAVSLFFDKFDGSALACILQEYWLAGAKAVKRLGEVIQANYVTKLDEALRQLHNSFDKIPVVNAPAWFHPVADAIQELYGRLSKADTLHGRLLDLAKLLADRHLYGQATICLQLAVEAYLNAMAGGDGLGEYERTKSLYDHFIKDELPLLVEKGKLHTKARQHLLNLRDTRNSIAHGGSASHAGGIPQESSLASQFETYSHTINLLHKLKK